MTTSMHNIRQHRRRARADPRLRLAVRLLDLLTRESAGPSLLAYPAARVHQTSADLIRLLRYTANACERRWEAAIPKLVSRIPSAAELLRSAVAALVGVVSTGGRRSALPLTLRDLYAELIALEQEFGAVEIDLREAVLSVRTEPIMLEDEYLGPFRIELRLPQLTLANRGREGRGRAASRIPGQWNGQPLSSDDFACVAIDPHPAASCEATTHPHVRDDRPCLGDATGVATAALWEGRLCDAFLAVQAVLQTYNATSPYTPLEEWNGRSCSDCGRATAAHDLFTCNSCDSEICDDCSRSCDGCNHSHCLACLDRSADGDQLCEPCRGTCRNCRRIYSSVCLETGGGLCTDCAEEEAESSDPQDIEGD